MFQKTAKTTTNAGDYPANVPKNGQNNNKRRRLSRKCSKKWPKRSRGLRRARYETRVGSPPDFQLKRVSGKCSKNQPKQQQTPEKKLRQMFHKMAMLNRDAGRPSLNKAKLTCPACVNRDAGRPSLRWKQVIAHTNLPCLRQSRRRQTELSLKVPRTFSFKKARQNKKASSAKYA